MHMLTRSPSDVGTLQGLGYAEVDLGVDRFKSDSERRIAARDAVDTLVDRHRRRSPKDWSDTRGALRDVIAQESWPPTA